MGQILSKLKGLFSQSTSSESHLSILDIKPQFSSNNEYITHLESEIQILLEQSGHTEDQVNHYIESSSIYNNELEDIYSKMHSLYALKQLEKA